MKSKTHWFVFILIPFLLFFGLGMLFLGISIVYKTKELAFGTYIMSSIFSSTTLALCFFSIFNSKTISIGENEIIIKFPLKRKVFKYQLKQIIGFDERFDYDRFGEYRTFNFSIDDKNIFMFSSKEYINYNDLAIKISTLCPPSEISFYKNSIPLLKYFITTFLFVSFLLYLTKFIS
jgi:hypothetical protein